MSGAVARHRGGDPGTRRLAGTVALVATAVLLTACHAELVLDVDLNADGSGRVRVRVTTDQAALAAVDRAVADAGAASDVDVGHPLDAFAATVTRLDGWELTDTVTDDGGRTVAATTDVDGPAELARVTGQLAGALDVPEGRLLGPLQATLDGDRLQLDGELAADVDPAAALGWREDGVATRGRLRLDDEPLTRVLARDDPPVSVRLTATMPGPVIDSDADAVDGRQLTWRARLGEVRRIRAVARRPEPSTLPWLAGGIVAVGLVAALGGGWWWRRRS